MEPIVYYTKTSRKLNRLKRFARYRLQSYRQEWGYTEATEEIGTRFTPMCFPWPVAWRLSTNATADSIHSVSCLLDLNNRIHDGVEWWALFYLLSSRVYFWFFWQFARLGRMADTGVDRDDAHALQDGLFTTIQVLRAPFCDDIRFRIIVDALWYWHSVQDDDSMCLSRNSNSTQPSCPFCCSISVRIYDADHAQWQSC